MPNKKQIKQQGQIYTPNYLVKIILDSGEYNNYQILQKHVIDNSCGDGAFLCEIVKRYCDTFLSISNDLSILQKELEIYVHGIEIQKQEYDKTISNLNDVVKKYNLNNINWDIINSNALSTTKYNNKMDFVFGNPPYVRIHNLKENYKSVKKFLFADKGMTDLYIVFFEIGFNMLKNNGKMCIITPSSWLNSKAGQTLRKYIGDNKNLYKVIDLEHFQAFEATTYSLISCFQKNTTSDYVSYHTFNEQNLFIDFKDNLLIKDFIINNEFYFLQSKELELLRKIKTNRNLKYVEVKNGFATLNDKVFIGDFDFKECTIPVLKASTGKWSKIIFPYDTNGTPLSPMAFKQFGNSYNHLLKHKNELSKHRDISKENFWYLFGRTQAIKDVFKNKYAINTIIKNINSIKLEEVQEGKGVYSGMYILTKASFETIRKIILSENFINYIKSLRKYKSGGYYTFSSKDLELYLNYILGQQNE